MMKWTIIGIVVIGAALFFLRRLVYDPQFTDFARAQFILDALRTMDFDTLALDHQEKRSFGDITTTAHWKVHRHSSRPGLIVEFDVHPSSFPLCISASQFVYLRDKGHLAAIKKELSTSDNYSGFVLSKEDVQKILFG